MSFCIVHRTACSPCLVFALRGVHALSYNRCLLYPPWLMREKRPLVLPVGYISNIKNTTETLFKHKTDFFLLCVSR